MPLTPRQIDTLLRQFVRAVDIGDRVAAIYLGQRIERAALSILAAAR